MAVNNHQEKSNSDANGDWQLDIGIEVHQTIQSHSYLEQGPYRSFRKGLASMRQRAVRIDLSEEYDDIEHKESKKAYESDTDD